MPIAAHLDLIVTIRNRVSALTRATISSARCTRISRQAS